MKDRDIDEILRRAAEGAPEVDPALLDRVSQSIGSSLRPVRPLPPAWVLRAGMALIGGAVAVAGGLLLKPYGVEKMSGGEIALIFSVLAALIWIAAGLSVAETIPGSRRPMAPWILLAGGCIGLALVFALLFHDYGSERFVSQGVKCLTAGLALAVPASIAAGLVLRRGFAVSPAAAGLAIGTLAGLAGVTMLELHCANFEAPHVMVWHIAVLAISGAVGALAAWATRAKRLAHPGL